LNPVKFTQTVDLEFTFESNRLEGNTLIARNGTCYQGVTIAGKTMKEHLED
jgi:hypothetical protein